MVDIFKVPKKETINRTMQAKSIMVVGRSKSGKSTLASQAPRAVFLMTENGGEALTGFTPIPITSWSDFKSAVRQLCSPQGRENFDTVVIDTYTNLILLLDKYAANRVDSKEDLSFASDADFGKGTKVMKNELGIELQKLANQGYLLLNIVHAEDKTDFATGKHYIGTSLSPALYGVAEKFVDQIIYLSVDKGADGKYEHNIWFNGKGGFDAAGGRFTPDVDYVPCSYENLEKALLGAMDKASTAQGAKIIESGKPSVVIEEQSYDYDALMEKFRKLAGDLMSANQSNGAKITAIVDKYLGKNKKISEATPSQCEQIDMIVQEIEILAKDLT